MRARKEKMDFERIKALYEELERMKNWPQPRSVERLKVKYADILDVGMIDYAPDGTTFWLRDGSWLRARSGGYDLQFGW